MTEEKNTETKTTGHEWDGISEYNIPAPRWWLIVWIICIIWAFGYWIFYPTWPIFGGNSKGILGWSQQLELQESQAEINARKSFHLEKISKMNLQEIRKDHDLMRFAVNGGRAAFKENCAACHGSGAQGAKNYPNLNDDDWLWGGKLEDIYQTIKYGIRSGHNKARENQMPAFGIDKVLKKDQIEAVAEYVMSLTGKTKQNAEGEKIFKDNCVACHGEQAKGNRNLGAPNLTDAIWLYGGNKEDIRFTVYYARNGVMPYWSGRLDDNTIKQLTLYVHSLGGGE
ncbi:MAG: cytochrome-c oxidase, cbb3-type subunit III [Alphaproteobacteria bacterium RIFCSPLOWO2_01_FULL_40_26]|nr:MAG: cytochrome-c oxidase, cbb3-type subunit III [Alphaproteobacteria bacterium RIFCSPHIGHO2_02_FULL_40_34]OFW93915.1 MAG: cytochrome-c oxidase, cbb3-type subunit III [Alphaproteobacteria bacterium RIFCSPLOWO2_01_FULL_40_26]OFX09409.1 MAG: cytochrome-c oxidase, cbb3-type subunit III [Alphaproteobacteria bacterium RIFCSPLOWO2_02_FULL_40_19]OFX11974.1 MAG: cytochrome-c oxidase, cbb3-type subunit III [Alphaproteobacteria bacterium RIFCSPLOWO2_12_FULL_40_11]